VSEPYYSQRARNVCVSLSVFFSFILSQDVEVKATRTTLHCALPVFLKLNNSDNSRHKRFFNVFKM